MSDAAAPRTTEVAPGVRPRISLGVFWIGLAASVFVGGVLTLIAYSEGLPFDQIPQLDKVVHFGMGGALAFFLDGVLRQRMLSLGPSAWRLRIPLAALLVLVPVGIEEFLQRYSLYRTSSFADFAADLAGVTFCIWLSRRLTG